MSEHDDGRAYAPITMGSVRSRRTEVGDFLVTDAWFAPGSRLDRHAHERRVFAVMLDGSFELAFDRRKLECTPSTVFTEPGGEAHSNAMGDQGAHVVVVQPANDSPLVAPCERMLGRINHYRDGILAGLARRLGREVRAPDDVSELAAEALAQEMLALGARRTRDERIARDPPSWFKRVEEMVHDRCLEKLRIGELAKEAGVHSSHVARVFRERYGLPLGSFIRRLRLEWATDELLSTEKPLSRIALEAGFSDQSHFTRAFRRKTGMPPGRYRQLRLD